MIARANTRSGASLLQFRCRTAAHQYLPFYDLVRRHVPKGADVLDWGSGNGHASYFLAHAGYRVSRFVLGEGPDTADWYDDAPWPGTLPPVIVGPPDEPVRLPLDDGSYSAVTSVGVIEHVEETGGDFLGSLRELRRIVRPGGFLVGCHLPARSSWIEWSARRLPGSRGHQHPFGRSEFKELLTVAGWELLELNRYGFLPRNFWARAPQLGDRPAVAEFWDTADQLLGRSFRGITQNFRFAARRGTER